MIKIILTIALTLTSLLATTTSQSEDLTSSNNLCKVFSKKALEYEKKMRNDNYAKVTLDSYKHRAKLYCSK